MVGMPVVDFSSPERVTCLLVSLRLAGPLSHSYNHVNEDCKEVLREAYQSPCPADVPWARNLLDNVRAADRDIRLPRRYFVKQETFSQW